ncbi:pyridoxamine 5'-phosphate oxidase family protein [Halorarum salinum]|uniref:Pyridoxamine 5'-phosphate oxidase family protein n=1 Tax=Halorarum salinum TaxID=2743089 RepID=A0A7D5L9E4_9EURY|nr:pyridoxamine 5'-phosphate oxidase family protein [Halobaculum salinum]QLG61172.1 pyridoxamine 5'-phosphate oxidase family protein [Halobaculum salinum]
MNGPFTYTAGMDEAEVEAALGDAGTAVLALADGDRAYAVPVSYARADGDLVVRLTDDGDATKLAFLDATEEVVVLVYDDDPKEGWSVQIRGRLVRLEESAARRVRDRFDPFRVFDEDLVDLDVRLYRVDPTARAGRRVAR